RRDMRAGPGVAWAGEEGALVSHLGGGAGSLGYNLPLSRALERALEEAAHSGGLSLSARKLKEFPRGAPGHDLSDTVRAGEPGAGIPLGTRRGPPGTGTPSFLLV
uniref:Uncharacterized protein n=1 Tax=Gopherus agassizii TaxID=38772 RepID=A0A452H3R0_9SAUR